jgi:hypothetical protein
VNRTPQLAAQRRLFLRFLAHPVALDQVREFLGDQLSLPLEPILFLGVNSRVILFD